MKAKILIIIVLIVVIGISIIKVNDYFKEDTTVKEVISIPVKTIAISESSVKDALVYQGVITPNKIEQIGFKTTARLETFNGEIGELLAADTILVELDISDMQLSLNAADNQLSAAMADYQRALKGSKPEDIELANISVNKATEAVDYLENKVADLTKLFEEGIVSQSELEGVTLELNLALSDLELASKSYDKAISGAEKEVILAAQAVVELAKTNKKAQQSLIEDATYTLTQPRVLIERFYEEGELVPAGYPVAILRSIEQGVILGVTRNDLDKVFIGQKAEIVSDRLTSLGEVVRIAEIPDQNHFLYEVEVSVDNEEYKVGEIVSCQLMLGTKNVVMIPISAIMNDGIDYVFVNDNGIAAKRKVVIEEVLEGKAMVTGLEMGDEMVINNLNKIHEKSKIHIEE